MTKNVLVQYNLAKNVLVQFFSQTTHSHGCGNVNARKTRAARRMSILMMFNRNFAFFKEKYGA
jgi:hypothetical protein